MELPLALLRFGVLALLWLFVLAAVRVIRHDLFGPPVAAGGGSARPAPHAARPVHRSAARRLLVTSGPLAGTAVGLNDRPITFGRGSSCTVVLGDDYVSNQHARLTPAGDRWMLEDLGSTNGTYLSERRVTDATPVPLGAPIRLGRTTLELRG